MDTFNLLIVAEHAQSIIMLKGMLQFYSKMALVGEANTIEQLLDQVNTRDPHIVIIDIDAGSSFGIEAVKACCRTNADLKIIIVANDHNYAIEAFELSVIDYILKPVHASRLRQAFEKSMKSMNVKITKPLTARSASDPNRKFIVRADNTIHFIPLDDIIFIEKVARKSLIHTSARVIEINDTLSLLANHLSLPFVQTHRSYIINYQHISNIVHNGDTYLVYFNKYSKHAYVSKNKLPEVMDQFTKMNEMSALVSI